MTEEQLEVYLIEYQKSQDSAQHFDTLLWSSLGFLYTIIFAILSTILFGVHTELLNLSLISFSFIILFMILIHSKIHIEYKKLKYNRCKKIEKELQKNKYDICQHLETEKGYKERKKWFMTGESLLSFFWFLMFIIHVTVALSTIRSIIFAC